MAIADGGNHDDVTSPWSGPPQSHIAVVGGGRARIPSATLARRPSPAVALLAASVLAQPAARARTTAQAGAAGPDTVNIMTFDYYLAKQPKPLDVDAEAIAAVRNVPRQLAALYPWSSQRHLWAMEGITILPGIDDYPGKTEITYLSDTRRILGFARAHGLGLLSIWRSSGTTAAARAPSTAIPAPASISPPGPSATCSSGSRASAGTTPR
jgi:hypothetical protein